VDEKHPRGVSAWLALSRRRSSLSAIWAVEPAPTLGPSMRVFLSPCCHPCGERPVPCRAHPPHRSVGRGPSARPASPALHHLRRGDLRHPTTVDVQTSASIAPTRSSRRRTPPRDDGARRAPAPSSTRARRLSWTYRMRREGALGAAGRRRRARCALARRAGRPRRQGRLDGRPEGPEAGPQALERPAPLAGVLHDADAGRQGGQRLAGRSQHDDWAGAAADEADDVTQQGRSVPLQARLRRAHAEGPPAGEDDPGGHGHASMLSRCAGAHVSLQRAIDLAREHAARTEPEDVPVGSAAGRRLAAAVTARADLPPRTPPPWTATPCGRPDTPGALALAGESAAGPPLAAPPTGRGGCVCSRDAPCGDMQLDVRPHRDDPAG